MRLALLCAAAVVAVAFAGCSTDSGRDGPTGSPAPEAPDAAIVHRAGRLVVDAAQFPGPIPTFEQRHVTQRISGEPTIAVTRSGAAFYPAIDFDGPNGLPRTVLYRSLDEGQTWHDHSPHIGSMVGTHTYSTDPYVYADPTTNRLFTVDMTLQASCNHVSWTDDEGQTWGTQPAACPLPLADHPTLFAGPRGAVPNLPDVPGVGQDNQVRYPNNVYLCTNEVAQTQCSVSHTGGLTWEPSQPVYFGVRPEGAQGDDPSRLVCSAFTGHGHASWASDGTVYLPKAHCREPQVAVSRDAGQTWQSTVVAAGDKYLTAVGDHEAAVATDRNGTAYYLWLGGNGTVAYLSVSRDMGATWSLPIDITRPGLTAVKLPALAAGEDGRIAALYVGTGTPSGWEVHGEGNEDELGNATWHAYVTTSLDARAADPVFASVVAHDPAQPLKRGGCAGRCMGNDGGMYDFFDIQVDPMHGELWVAMVDVCSLRCDDAGQDARAYQRAMGAVAVQTGGAMLLDRAIDPR